MIPDLDALLLDAAAFLDRCRAARLTVATAESCTGGLIAAILTEIPGSSDVFERGFVTYSNAAKVEMLGVSAALIARQGAVSREVALAMAKGALDHSPASLSIAVTGIAGPGGGTSAKPVGLVYLAAARRSGAIEARELRIGDIGRAAIRFASAKESLALVGTLL